VREGGKAKVLVADDQEALRTLLAKLLAREGFEPIEAQDGEIAIELYRTLRPSVVVTDVMMPKMDGLTLLEEIKAIQPAATVILMTGHGNEEVLLKALRGGASNFFKKPFNLRSLVTEIRKIMQYKVETAQVLLYSPYLVEESKDFSFAIGDPQYHAIVSQITLQLPSLLPESDVLNLKIGLEEMIVNAIEHGNLRISFEEKNAAIEEGKLGELLAERLRQNNNAARRVHVHSHLTMDSLRVSIRDEGEGFDWRNLPKLRPENLLLYGGRGIFLTKIYFDEVSYNESGNEVTLVKNRRIPLP